MSKVIAGITLCVLFIAGAPLGPFAVSGLAFGAAGVAFIFSAEHRRERWLAFLDLASHLLSLVDDAVDGGAIHHPRLLAVQPENLFQTGHVIFGLT